MEQETGSRPNERLEPEEEGLVARVMIGVDTRARAKRKDVIMCGRFEKPHWVGRNSERPPVEFGIIESDNHALSTSEPLCLTE